MKTAAASCHGKAAKPAFMSTHTYTFMVAGFRFSWYHSTDKAEKGGALSVAYNVQTKPGLTGNQLKILAMATMTIDHVGLELLPGMELMRIIGRLALPIYAYMIAEGCRYTHDRRGYLLRVAALAALCQGVYFLVMGSLYQCILVTFSLAICLIYAVDNFRTKQTPGAALTLFATVFAVRFLCAGLPRLLSGYAVDYGFWGAVLPVLVYLGWDRWSRAALLTVGLVLLGMAYGGIQWWALAAVPLLLLYNGQRGKWQLGKIFYLYYPLHLAVIYAIGLLIKV